MIPDLKLLKIQGEKKKYGGSRESNALMEEQREHGGRTGFTLPDRMKHLVEGVLKLEPEEQVLVISEHRLTLSPRHCALSLGIVLEVGLSFCLMKCTN